MTAKQTQTNYFQVPASTINHVKSSVDRIYGESSVSVGADFAIFLSALVTGFLLGFGLDFVLYLFTDYSGFYATSALVASAILVFASIFVRDKLQVRTIRKELWEGVADFSKELNSWFMLTHYLSVSEPECKRVAEDMLFLGGTTRFRTTDSRLCTLTQRKGTNTWDLNKSLDTEPVVPSAVETVWTPAANDIYIQVQKSISSLRTCVLTVEEEHEVSRAETTLEELVQSVTQLTHLDEVTEADSERIIYTMNILNDGLQKIFAAKTNNVRKNLDLIHGFVAEKHKASKGSNLSL